MDTEIKTIFMTRAQWETWEAALLSDKYAQCANTLRDANGYCCLGVLQHALTGEVEQVTDVPTFEWLADQNIRFKTTNGTAARTPCVRIKEYEYSTYPAVTELNDAFTPFDTIAKLMKPHVQFIDEP